MSLEHETTALPSSDPRMLWRSFGDTVRRRALTGIVALFANDVAGVSDLYDRLVAWSHAASGVSAQKSPSFEARRRNSVTMRRKRRRRAAGASSE
jgi:hypothetical protein